MAVVQLDFFEQTEISILKAEIASLKDSANRCRKKQFSEIGTIKKESREEIAILKKQILELKENVDLLIRNICHANN